MKKICILWFLWICNVNPSFGQACEINQGLLEKVKFNHLLFITNTELDKLNIDSYFLSGTYDLHLGGCSLYISKCNAIDNSFPKKEIVLYELINNLSIYECGNKDITYFQYYNEKFLVGVDTTTNNILFISGSFYQSPIASYFELKVSDPSTFIKFLELKFYAYNMNNFTYLKTTDDKIMFTAEFKDYDVKNIIAINLKDFNDIKREVAN